jgi:PKD repeat protein
MIDALPPAQIPADFSYVISSCSTVTFSAPACATSYLWDFGDATAFNVQNPTHTYAANGTYLVTLTLNGSTTVQHTIVIGLPASSATILGPSQVCLASGPPFYNYSANTQPGLTYNWTVSNGAISGFSNNDNIDVVWSTLPGMVHLTVTDPVTGCSATKTLTVIENCNPNQCVAPPAGIVNWWTFDETSGATAQDIRGFVNNTGAHVNGPTPVAGVVAGALSFDGVNDWVEVANNPELNFLGGCILDFAEPLTIDLWVKTNIQPGTGPTSGLLTILDKRVNTSSPNGYHLFLFNGRLGFQMSGINYVAPAAGLDYIDVADNQWHFVAVSLPMCRGVGSGFLYIDGKTVLTLPRGAGFNNTAKLYIGRRDPAFGANFFKGAFDELEMFKTALSDDELRALFEARSHGKCKIDCSTKTITISPAMLPQLTWPVHVAYPTLTLTGSGGAAPYNFAVTGGTLPPGMTVDSSGTLSGTPTQLGLYIFTVTVIDADGCRATRIYRLAVGPAVR